MKRYTVYRNDCEVLSKCFAIDELDACRKAKKNIKKELGLDVDLSELRAVEYK